jgi:ABC-type branched-subunit amino acid transport system ATPase component
MILFKKARAKNFLSIGNTFLEYDLNVDSNCLLKGSNGSGKCVDTNTIIKLRNKKTGEIIETTIGKFYDIQKE